MSERLTLTALAKRLGRSKQAIHQLVKKGVIPKGEDGKFDEAEARKAYARNTAPHQRKTLKPAVKEDRQPLTVADDDEIADLAEAREAISLIRRVLREEGRELDGPLSYDDVRTAETILKSRKHAQEIAVAEQELIRKAPVMRHVEEAFANFRKELQAIPARFGAQIAAEVGCDVAAVDVALNKVIRDFLGSLSAPVVKAQ